MPSTTSNASAGDDDALGDGLADLLRLTPAQQIAALAIAEGAPQADAAASAGLSRETVNRLANRHPGFRAAVNGYRSAIAVEHSTRLRRLVGKALDAVELTLDAADAENRLDAALAVLRLLPPAAVGALLDDGGASADPARLFDIEAHAIGHTLPPAPRKPQTVDQMLYDMENADPARERAMRERRIAADRIRADIETGDATGG